MEGGVKSKHPFIPLLGGFDKGPVYSFINHWSFTLSRKQRIGGIRELLGIGQLERKQKIGVYISRHSRFGRKQQTVQFINPLLALDLSFIQGKNTFP